ncbi:hypothetical protein L9F63_017699, partial [Diploptera punctata]
HVCAGKLSMANAGPNSNSSQFFISTVPCSHLDNVNVVFGEVKKGFGVVEEISQVATDKDRPIQEFLFKLPSELKPDEDWGIAESDGTIDKYPPYPEDLDLSSYSLEVEAFQNIISDIKNSGNHFYNTKDYEQADRKYKKAQRYIEWYRTKPKENELDKGQKIYVAEEIICLLNSAAVSLKRRLFRDALLSCDKVLKIDNENVKAMFRRGQALRGLNDYDGALRDLKRARTFSKNDRIINAEIISLKTEMNNYLQREKIIFEKMFKKWSKKQCSWMTEHQL